MTEHNKDNMFKKGTLLAHKGNKGESSGFVVFVTKEMKDSKDLFKGVVVANRKEGMWELGHKSKCWVKDKECWEVVDFPSELY